MLIKIEGNEEMSYYASPRPHPYFNSENEENSFRSNEEEQEILAAILTAIKREASAYNLYYRLAYEAPTVQEQQDLLRSLEEKQDLVTNFSHLYIELTGSEPTFQMEHIPYEGYENGVQRAFEIEAECFSEYKRCCTLTNQPEVLEVFESALANEQEVASRFDVREERRVTIRDYGPGPFVIDIEEATKQNNTFRTALWTGEHLQITLMSIPVGEDIGLEIHPHLDQFLRIEDGEGIVQMGDQKDRLTFERKVKDDFAIVIPAGKWHNVTNTGNKPLKLYSIYAPPQHPFGTVHKTKAEAMLAEEMHQ